MPTYLVTADGHYHLEREVDADGHDEAIDRAQFSDADLNRILLDATWEAREVDGR